MCFWGLEFRGGGGRGGGEEGRSKFSTAENVPFFLFLFFFFLKLLFVLSLLVYATNQQMTLGDVFAHPVSLTISHGSRFLILI